MKYLYLVTPPDEDGGVECDTLVVATDAILAAQALAAQLGLSIVSSHLAFTDDPVEESWHVRRLPDPNSCLPGLVPWDDHSYFVLEE